MIQANRLLKYYGSRRALGEVSLEIDRGEAVGVVGLNGVGKTTLLRILATDLRPTAGSVLVDGVDAIRDPFRVRRRIGFLPERPPLYPEMVVLDYLRFAGRLHGLEGTALEARLEEVTELTHVRGVQDFLVRHLSHGYRQRVGLAQAILHDPELLILDEPTHGLDPAQVVEMRGLVRQLKEHHTVLISSHNLPEISETCDRLMVMDAGQVVAIGTETELSDRLFGAMRIEVAVRRPDGAEAEAAGQAARVAAQLAAVDGVRAVTAATAQPGELAFVVEAHGDRRAEVCRSLVDGGWAVLRLDRGRHVLEDVFLGLVGVGMASEADSRAEQAAAAAAEPVAATGGRTA